MHEQWQEMISFYVAGSLPPDQTRALEQHLSTCESCQLAAAEWQTIAQAVRAEATSWARQLPPLSAEIRASVQQRRSASPSTIAAFATEVQRRQPQREPRISRRAWAPLTALAAILLIALFGALLLSLSGRDDEREPTQVAMLSVITVTGEEREPASTETPVGEQKTIESDLGILPVGGTPTALPPTRTVIARPQASGALPPTPAPTLTNETAEMALLPGTCAVSPLGGPLTLYRSPDLSSDTVGTITAGQSLITYVRSENGWYQIVEIGPGILGWAPGSSLALSGACTDLPLPTPTINNTVCAGFIAGDRVIVRGGPGESYDSIDQVTLGSRVEVIAASDNGWYRIRHEVAPAVFIGWIPATTITISGACGELPVVPSAGYDPQNPETAIPTATYTPTPEPGQITGFTTSASTAARGSSFTVSWATRNAAQVWVEYYGIDMQTGQSSSGVLGSLPNAPASGEWTVSVPNNFAYSGIRVVIIVDHYENGLGIPRAELVVTIQG